MNKVSLTEREMLELDDDVTNCNSAENLENLKAKILKYGCTDVIMYNGNTKVQLLSYTIRQFFANAIMTKYHLMLIDFAIEKTENIDGTIGYSESPLRLIISNYYNANSVKKREIYSIVAKKLIDAGAKIGNRMIDGVVVNSFDIPIMIYDMLKKENDELRKIINNLDLFAEKLEENMLKIYNPKVSKKIANTTGEIKELGIIKDFNFTANLNDDVLIITAKNDKNLDEYECYVNNNDKSNVMSTSDVFTPENLSPSDIFGMFDEKIERSINFNNYGPQIVFHTVHPVKSLCADITLNFKEKKCDIVGKMQKQIDMLIAKNEKLEKELCDIKQQLPINNGLIRIG